MTTETPTTTTLTDTLIEGLCAAGFDSPDVVALFSDSDLEAAKTVTATLDYYKPDAFRVTGDNLTLVHWSNRDELLLVVMTLNGVTKCVARFHRNELGAELLIGAASVTP